MNRFLPALFVGSLWFAAAMPSGETTLPAPLKARLDTILVEDLKRHAAFLTSPACAGRDTPQPGLEKARDYLIEHHQKFGLESGHPDGSYRFEYDVPAIVFAPDDHVAVLKGVEVDAFLPGVDFVPVRRSGSGTVEGEVVFCGYGIVDAEEKYDDFKGIDVKGKVVALLLHEPREQKKGRAFKGVEWTDHSRISRKGRVAAERGAAAVLLFTDPANHDDLTALKGEFPRYGQLDPKSDCPIPVVHCSGVIADLLFGQGQLLAMQKTLDSKLAGAPRALAGTRVRLKVALNDERVKTHDVVAVKRGSDPLLKDEWIVLGAHYDHIGVDEFGRVFHGADDNGSGTSCMLEIAEAIGPADVTFKRSLLLIHFSGEEHGLLGSAAYCKAPLQPADKTLAMINMDMVGRGRPHDIDAAGLAYSADFQALVRKATTLSRARLKVGEGGMQYFKRSDQLEFWRAGIPVLFFMEPEEHADYHQVTDTADKLVFGKIAETAKLVTVLAWLLGEAERRPKQEGIPP